MARKPVAACEFVSDDLRMRLQVSLRADVDSLSPVVDRIMKIVAEMACAGGKEFEIETALREALSNAVIHGCKGDARRRVKLSVLCDEDRGMLLIVRDPGTGFDPAVIPSPVIGENIFSTHGRGIFIINQLMDEVTYKRGGTEIYMRKR